VVEREGTVGLKALDAFTMMVDADFVATVGVKLIDLSNQCTRDRVHPLTTPDGAQAILVALALLTLDLSKRMKAGTAGPFDSVKAN
jgi:hypothetical protein